MTDNLDMFKKIVFSIPSLKKILTASLTLSILFSSLVFVGFKLFTTLQPPLHSIMLMAIFAFALPAFLSGELLHRFIPDYPRKWGYFLALSNMTLLFLYGTILTGADNFTNAWHIFWLALSTSYLSHLLVLLLTVGDKYITRLTLLSLIQPLSILVAFHVFLGSRLQISLIDYASGIMVLGVSALLVLAAIGVAEYLLRANLENASVLQLTAGLIQKRQEALDLGYPTKPDVQTLQIENQVGKTTLLTPWIHPGPLEGFGGGRITSDIIEKLNKEDEGFFFHVPSTHKSDPANPEAYKKILKARKDPQKIKKASKLVEKDYEKVKFYGRKVGSKKLVYMDAEWDDYRTAIFREIIDPEKVLLVDLHCHDRKEEERPEVFYDTDEARYLRNSLKDFIQILDRQKEYKYKAGFSTETTHKSLFSLVEKVDGQKTLIFGLEGNGTSQSVRKTKKQYEKEYDKVIVFSTDTHQSIHDLFAEKQVNISRIKQTVQKAEKNLSEASLGLTNNKSNTIKLLKEDYSGLIFSVNILVRLIIFLLAVVYIWLIIWVFF